MLNETSKYISMLHQDLTLERILRTNAEVKIYEERKDAAIGRLVRSKLAGSQIISTELSEVPITFCTISLDEVNEIDKND